MQGFYMGNVVAFEWLSGDGVFDADFMEEWFFPYDSPERRKFIKETYREANAFLMGRNTYEMLAPYWSQLPDEDMDGLAGVLYPYSKIHRLTWTSGSSLGRYNYTEGRY